ncbi:Hint domain-containing protein [Neokomagataea thailandica]|uniref:Outer membrane protein n=1 Tax=Neokomagataea tanensis NBRC 106556 TaxID=1223519 RepID=A0ABQ0QIB3_9PROT|nr:MULTISPECIES: Hint domain-containing protein [Neokomagataea]GBR45774.1 outer membrane protein [Neokomagataea tanensis NBRC 106556]
MAQDITGKEFGIRTGDGNNSTTSLNAGSAGGYLNVTVAPSLNADTTSVQTINVTSADNTNFHIGFTTALLGGLSNGLNVSVTKTYNGTTTQVTLNFSKQVIGQTGSFLGAPTYGLVTKTATPLVINITGNPFGLNAGYNSTTNISSIIGGIFGSQYDVCFLAGSQIKTPAGLSNIEDINIGDRVVISTNDTLSDDTVTWVGKAHCTINKDLPDDQAGYPVRILKDAIAEGTPFEDLLVTPEHCLFFDGKFIPARMLINNRSVFYDKSYTSYDYYHIETAQHSVITANGVLTESYLDTGNRSSFRNKNVFFIGYQPKTWEMDAAAPLCTTPDIVEPIFRAIEHRALTNNVAPQSKAPHITQDANVFLLTDQGVALHKMRETNGHMVFMLPKDTQAVRIISRASRPCDIVGAFWDDRRSIGVGIGEVSVFEWNQRTPITAHKEIETLDGWNNLEDAADKRWTTGNAFLPLNRTNPEDHALLSLEVESVDYILEDDRNEDRFYA